MADYHIIDANGVERGPFSHERICQRIREGRSEAQTLARKDGGKEWVTLGGLAEFSAALQPGDLSAPRPASPFKIPDAVPSGKPRNARECPVCGSQRSVKASGRHKAGFVFQAFPNRTCVVCDTTWRPRCPTWAAILILVAGIVVPGSVILVDATASRQLQDFQAIMASAPAPSPPLWTFSSKPATSTAPASKLIDRPNSIWLRMAVIGTGLALAGYGLAVLLGREGRLEILEKGTPPDR